MLIFVADNEYLHFVLLSYSIILSKKIKTVLAFLISVLGAIRNEQRF